MEKERVVVVVHLGKHPKGQWDRKTHPLKMKTWGLIHKCLLGIVYSLLGCINVILLSEGWELSY